MVQTTQTHISVSNHESLFNVFIVLFLHE